MKFYHNVGICWVLMERLDFDRDWDYKAIAPGHEFPASWSRYRVDNTGYPQYAVFRFDVRDADPFWAPSTAVAAPLPPEPPPPPQVPPADPEPPAASSVPPPVDVDELKAQPTEEGSEPIEPEQEVV